MDANGQRSTVDRHSDLAIRIRSLRLDSIGQYWTKWDKKLLQMAFIHSTMVITNCVSAFLSLRCVLVCGNWRSLNQQIDGTALFYTALFDVVNQHCTSRCRDLLIAMIIMITLLPSGVLVFALLSLFKCVTRIPWRDIDSVSRTLIMQIQNARQIARDSETLKFRDQDRQPKTIHVEWFAQITGYKYSYTIHRNINRDLNGSTRK